MTVTLFDLAELDRDDLRHALLLHGDAEQRVGLIHGGLSVSDDDELRVMRELFEVLGKAVDVGFVERRLDLVEDTEGHGARL